MGKKRTECTVKQYENRYRLLAAASARQHGINVDQVEPGMLVDDLAARQESDGGNAVGPDSPKRAGRTLAKSSFRQYKAALVWAFECEIQKRPDEDARPWRDALARLASLPQTGYRNRGAATSGKREKKLPKSKLSKIISELHRQQRKGDRWAALTAAFLMANRTVGLRPIEWADAKLEVNPFSPGRHTLVVQNAKHDDTRGNGSTRRLDLTALGGGEIAWVAGLVKVAEGSRDGQLVDGHHTLSFKDALTRMRRSMYKATKRLFPNAARLPSLYSTRHQFVADAKYAGYSTEEIAALLGHASDATATFHYGRRVSGAAGLKVRANSENVRNVRRVARCNSPRASPE